MCHSQPLFLYFHLDSKQMFDIKFATDWIRTTDIWKQPLYQLSHNHYRLCLFTYRMKSQNLSVKCANIFCELTCSVNLGVSVTRFGDFFALWATIQS